MPIRLLCLAVAIAVSGCFVDVPDVDDGAFACRDDGDCIDGYRCIAELCMPAESPDVGFCGNGSAEEQENCDGGDLRGADCATLSLGGGSLDCNSDCSFNTTGCDLAPVCPNGVREGNEQCDGSDTPPCTSLGNFTGGTSSCRNDCSADVSQCNNCGNDVAEVNEQCDTTDLAGATCENQSLGTGTLTCDANCLFDTSGCSTPAVCWDGTLATTENCDQTQVAAGLDCVSAGLDGGSPSCFDDGTCQNVDYRSCEPCNACAGGQSCIDVSNGWGCFLPCSDPSGCDSNSACVAAVDPNGTPLNVCKPCDDGSGGCGSPATHCEWLNPGSTSLADATVQCVSNWVPIVDQASGNDVGTRTGDARAVDIALAPSAATNAGELFVAWQNGNGAGSSINLEKFVSGAAWTDVNGPGTLTPLSDGSEARAPAIALNSGGEPSVAWEAMVFGTWVIQLLRMEAGGWNNVFATAGGIFSSSSETASRASIAVQNDGLVMVAWAYGDGTGNNYLGMRSVAADGSTSAQFSYGTPGEGWSAPALLVGPTTRVFGLKMGVDLETLDWGGNNDPNGANTVTLTGIADVPFDVAGARNGSRVLLAWSTGSSLEVWLSDDGGSSSAGWSSLGSASDAGAVVGSRVAAALAADGRPIVAWSEGSAPAQNVHLAWHDTSTWRSLGGSNEAGGVSQSAGGAVGPSLAVGPDPLGSADERVCLAWVELNPQRVGLRCHPL